MKRKILLLLLAMTMLLGAMTSCDLLKLVGIGGEEESQMQSGDVTESTNEKDSDSNSGEVSSENDDPEADSLGSYDFGKKEFTVLTKKDTKYEFSGNLGGDSVERAVYKRNYEVTKRFNATMKVVDKNGGWDQRSEFLSAVRAEAMGGDGGYDLVATHSVYLGWMTVEGLATDMAQLPEMDFSKAWWNQNLYDEININNHVYFMLGDICTTIYEYMQVLYVNEDAFDAYFQSEGGVDYLYESIDEGKWTWDMLQRYALAYGTTGNSEAQEYGFITNTHSWRASFVSMDVSPYTRDQNGDLTMESTPPTQLIDAVDFMVSFYSNRDKVLFNSDWSTSAQVLNPMFCSGTVLFYAQTLGEAKEISKSMKDSYGVVPLPKYDELQEKYYTQCRDTVSAVMIISTSDDPDMAGVLTEALCMYGHEIVTPEYYENVLMTRYFNDPRHAEMLETIRDGLTIVVPQNYIENIPDCDEFLDQVVNGRAGEVVSTYVGMANMGQRLFESFYIELKSQGLY